MTATMFCVIEMVIRDIKKTQVTEYIYGQDLEFKGRQVSKFIGLESVVGEGKV